MLAHGNSDNEQAIIISPIFEEMNFTRTFVADMARELSARGVGSWIPDLPGTGESLRELGELGWEDWRGAARAAGEAVAAQCGRKPHVVGLRGGALLGDAIDGLSWWSFATESGASLLRHLQRTQLISDQNNDVQISDIKDQTTCYAGYPLSPAMRGVLEAGEARRRPTPHRMAPPELQDARPKLWRMAEPGRDRELSAALAADIADWIATCEPR
jgi:hypothetical protein